MLVLPATAETVAGWVTAAESAPEQLSTIANVMNCPSLPFVPDEMYGSPVVMALVCHAGDPQDGQRALAPFRELATSPADMVGEIGYPELFPPEERPVPAG